MGRVELLACVLLGGCQHIPGTEEGGPCNQNQQCLEGMTCDGETNTCVSPDQVSWEKMYTPFNDVTLAAVWGSGPDDIYAVGQHKIIHYTGDGLNWIEETLDSQMTGASFDDVWAGGDEVWVVGSKIFNRKGAGQWSGQPVMVIDPDTKEESESGSITIKAVTGTVGTAGTSVWAVGQDYSYSGQSHVFTLRSGVWHVDTSPSFDGDDIAAVGGGIFVVGASNDIPIFDGSWTSTLADLKAGQELKGVWGLGLDSVWAVGPAETLLHYTGGKTWDSITVTNLPAASGIAGTPDGDFYIVGGNGGYYNDYSGIYHCGPSGKDCGPTPVTTDKTSSPSFHGVWCSDDGSTVVVVGDSGTVYRHQR